MKKYIINLTALLLFVSSLSAQDYESLMHGMKSKMENCKQFQMTISQNVYRNEVKQVQESFIQKISGKQGKIFTELPMYTIVQNETTFLAINEQSKVIMLGKMKKPINSNVAIANRFEQWESQFQTSLKLAESIKRLPHDNAHYFLLEMQTPQVATAKVKFDLQSGMLTWMEVEYHERGESIRMEYNYQYNFDSLIADELFDESKYVSNDEQPRAKAPYADYRVMLQMID